LNPELKEITQKSLEIPTNFRPNLRALALSGRSRERLIQTPLRAAAGFPRMYLASIEKNNLSLPK
jgi:hypothetical protein